MRKFIFLLVILISAFSNSQTISAENSVKSTLKTLLNICKSVDFSDPMTTDVGPFYKAAKYIVYTGNDKSRRWKDSCNYNVELERRMVNEACYRINETVNRRPEFEFGKFITETESEGTWYAIEVIYKKNGKEKRNMFAFLRIYGKFLLGDID